MAHKLTETAGQAQVKKGQGAQPVSECRGTRVAGPRDPVGTEGWQKAETVAGQTTDYRGLIASTRSALLAQGGLWGLLSGGKRERMAKPNTWSNQ